MANTPLLGLSLPTTGTLSGTWGDVVNAEITSLLDSAIAGTTTLTTDADVTLTTTISVANEAREAILLCTGARTVLRTITAPAQSKTYIIINATTGGQSVKLVGAGPTAGVTVLNGERVLVAWNGSDFVIVASSIISLTTEVSGTLPVGNGGTGATTLTLNNVLLGNGTSAVQVVAPGASGNVLTSDGTTWTSGSTSANVTLNGVQTLTNKTLTDPKLLLGGTNGIAGQALVSQGTGVAPTWASIVAGGIGGTTISGNVTLTAASPAAMTVTPSNYGQYATLPDATTCNKTDNTFSIYNNGEFDYGVKNSAGTKLGWIRAKSGAMIGLSDNSTSAGIWSYYGLQKIGNSATVNISSSQLNMVFTKKVYIDVNRTCFIIGDNTTGGGSMYGIIYDASTLTWGSATLIRTTSFTLQTFAAVASGANEVLILSGYLTAYQAVTLTLSGTSITVNTAVPVTLGGNLSGLQAQLVAVGTSFVVSYARSTNVAALRALTISSTVPTWGTELVIGASAAAVLLFPYGSIVVVLDNSGVATPYTVSVRTFTAGTASGTGTIGALALRVFRNGNGNIVAACSSNSGAVSIYKLTGTVATVSNADLFAGSAIVSASISNTDYFQITSSKAIFAVIQSSGGVITNILTDTAGTASVGTKLVLFNGVAITSVSGVAVESNIARFSFVYPTDTLYQLNIDCSGASPTKYSSSQLAYDATVETLTPSNSYGERMSVTAEGIAYAVSNLGVTAFYPNTMNINNRFSLSLDFASASSPSFIIGNTNSEAWLFGQSYDSVIFKYEVAV